jgi:hypothetical protein
VERGRLCPLRRGDDRHSAVIVASGGFDEMVAETWPWVMTRSRRLTEISA